MKTLTFKLALATVVVVLSTCTAHTSGQPTTPQGAKIYGDSSRGADIFKKWCLSCHATAGPATDQVPTVQQLAADPPHTDGAIRVFLMQPHRLMPPLELSTHQIEDIIAYLHTFRPEKGEIH